MQAALVSIRTRSYHPTIQFIGKRSLGRHLVVSNISLGDKSIGLNAPKRAPPAPQAAP